MRRIANPPSALERYVRAALVGARAAVSALRVPRCGACRMVVEDADPLHRCRNVRAMATGVHADPTTHRSRHADRPLKAAEPGGHGSPGKDRQRGCPASAHR